MVNCFRVPKHATAKKNRDLKNCISLLELETIPVVVITKKVKEGVAGAGGVAPKGRVAKVRFRWSQLAMNIIITLH